MKILVIVANFNQSIEIENFLSNLKSHWLQADTVVVDDGSSDGSAQLAENLGYVVLRHQKNLGIGAAIRTGILHAKRLQYEAVVIMSANGKMVPAEIKSIVEPVLSQECDYVTGSRFAEGGHSPGLGLFRRLAIPALSSFSYFFFGRNFSDITCGFRCYKIGFLFLGKANIEQDWLDRYEMEYYIHYYACRSSLRIKEVAVTIRYDHLQAQRKSKIVPILGWWSMLRPLLFLKFHLKK